VYYGGIKVFKVVTNYMTRAVITQERLYGEANMLV